MIVKLHRAFDKLFVNQQAAEQEIEGWEHKESITPVWVAVDSLPDLPDMVLYDELSYYVTAYGTEIESVVKEYETTLEESK